MPVFDFSDVTYQKEPTECTYTIFRTDESVASSENPIMVLDNSKRQ